MTRSMGRRHWIRASVALALAAALGCQIGGVSRAHTPLGPGADALRTAFNADSGAVRVVLLLAPT